MAVRDKDTLKTFFQTGDMPSQNEFADLIDSLKHENALAASLSDEEIIVMANRLVTINTPLIRYFADIGNATVKLEITRQNGQAQFIEMRSSTGVQLTQYFLGEAPYTVRFKEIQGAELHPTEYYFLYFDTDTTNGVQRLAGNNLPLPEGFRFGVLESKTCSFQSVKRLIGQQVNLVQSNIRFVNHTEIPIAYRMKSNYWANAFSTKDSVTDHYGMWDFLNFYYKADLSNQTDAIQCSIYNADTDELLTANIMGAGLIYPSFSGGYVNQIRNIRIECAKQ